MNELDLQFKIFKLVDNTKSFVILNERFHNLENKNSLILHILAHLIFCNRLVVYECFFIRLLFSSVDVVLKRQMCFNVLK